ncbi:hypothetical protein AGMMS50267_06150 [Spirochaetia bacterium]|nr:hypothetical protein AGMMS50267_06150 [Spirochaetia bacterium]
MKNIVDDVLGEVFDDQNQTRLSFVPIRDGLGEMLGIKQMIRAEEAYVKVNKSEKTKFAQYLFTHPKLKMRVTDNTLGTMPEYRFLGPYDGFGKHKNLHGGLVAFRDITLYDLMGQLRGLTHEPTRSFYVIDDDTRNYIGFLSYYKYTPKSRVINEVKFFNFDKKTGSMFKDTLQIMAELFRDHDEVRWTAFPDPESPVVPVYDKYVEQKKKEGCVATKVMESLQYVSVDERRLKTIDVFRYSVKRKK